MINQQGLLAGTGGIWRDGVLGVADHGACFAVRGSALGVVCGVDTAVTPTFLGDL